MDSTSEVLFHYLYQTAKSLLGAGTPAVSADQPFGVCRSSETNYVSLKRYRSGGEWRDLCIYYGNDAQGQPLPHYATLESNGEVTYLDLDPGLLDTITQKCIQVSSTQGGGVEAISTKALRAVKRAHKLLPSVPIEL